MKDEYDTLIKKQEAKLQKDLQNMNKKLLQAERTIMSKLKNAQST